MTQDEWLTETNLARLLETIRGKSSSRKLRWFGVHSARHRWRSLQVSELTAALEAAELYADNRGTAERERVAVEAAHFAIDYLVPLVEVAPLDRPLTKKELAEQQDRDSLNAVISSTPELAILSGQGGFLDRDQPKVLSFLRDIFGNPFRPVSLERTWLTPTVVRLAETIYDAGHFPSGVFDHQRLAILADALEDAGCANGDLLGHLRGGDHVRGCWAIDLLLGKA